MPDKVLVQFTEQCSVAEDGIRVVLHKAGAEVLVSEEIARIVCDGRRKWAVRVGAPAERQVLPGPAERQVLPGPSTLPEGRAVPLAGDLTLPIEPKVEQRAAGAVNSGPASKGGRLFGKKGRG